MCRHEFWELNGVDFTFSNSFPGPVRVIFLLKPEGVLQRALEVGYRGITENCKYKEDSFMVGGHLKTEALSVGRL
ncbi:hypothetical protein Tcan_16729 [Toxocara canis]|uniref:Uncharacterized protein n=1 Tax=Toxocara canis TaxID=6265 RepID=A0A0B2VAU8_TOXCA|nr:hypothetical protein Tcan_16729 [Toxocara canis]